MTATPRFPVGSVGHTLLRMCGVWHDHIELFDPSGQALGADAWISGPNAAPFDDLVYVDFDGVQFRQTSVTFRGRPQQVVGLTGELRDGVLHLAPSGPEDTGHIMISGGPSVLIVCAARIGEGAPRDAETACIHLTGPGQRTRAGVLYRDGTVVRTLAAQGVQIAPVTSARVHFDPRGPEGHVHAAPYGRVSSQG